MRIGARNGSQRTIGLYLKIQSHYPGHMMTLSARQLGALVGEWRAPNQSTYAALADRIRLLVLDGRIPIGARLPAER